MSGKVLDIHLDHIDKTFQAGECVSGTILIDGRKRSSHNGITLTLKGTVLMKHSSRNTGAFEAFYNSVRPIDLIFHTLELAPAGKLPSTILELPFSIPLLPTAEEFPLYETYHGVFVSIQYNIRVDVKGRSFMSGDLSETIEFLLENPPRNISFKPTPVDILISSSAIDSVKKGANVIPKFKITGKINSTLCPITRPFSGELVVEEMGSKIRTIDLQLIRVETCGCADGFSRDATEIQNIQISEGDVLRNFPIPIYMIFPRLFTCPTVSSKNFKIEFEVLINVQLENNHVIAERFPIKLIRLDEKESF
ncbi:hypothetical protein H696_03830 [Fonticula alba]|uniref:Uncharacterized protein n=1 Tax=Fonticula alba TaxID=691883 RepID=A0A058Z548_FONAL|nr:hypothetical protein H696_03830 [Fonticula alba]KCV69399.1 hypothetical protein H696_03830 [Fonticula alba]|eukprot:XP_009495964.1 hypothetical protein H696_03830 [Fonticula alba]